MMLPYRENGLYQNQLLPPNWEQAYDPRSRRIFYVDHNTRTTTWLNPLDNRPKSVSECQDEQLPYGWERVNDPRAGTYYANHIKRCNQWANPVDDSRFSQHHYSNSQHILNMEQSGNSLGSNNQSASQTTADTKPDTSDAEEKSGFNTSLNNSHSMSTDIIDTMRSNNSTRGSRHDDASLLDIMDNRFGRKSSQRLEV